MRERTLGARWLARRFRRARWRLLCMVPSHMAGLEQLLPGWALELLPIGGLLALIALVVLRLPRADLGHSAAFKLRRVYNWLPAGLTYAFLYMGRYNLSVCTDKSILALSYQEFSSISSTGKLVYGISFLLNGPLTDKFGGRKTIMLSAVGAAICNALMGLVIVRSNPMHPVAQNVQLLSILYAANMYFQSFGAVSIVKINAPWFHVRERGTFGGIFGILISLGLYFAYDWSNLIAHRTDIRFAFFVPAGILLVCAAVDYLLVRDTPGDAGHRDFDLGDGQVEGERLGLLDVARRMIRHPAIITITLIEFCSGFLRTGIMDTYKPFADAIGRGGEFVRHNWGMLNCTAGILGGVVAGLLSDRLFQSRRGPVAALLYSVMLLGCIAAFFSLNTSMIGWIEVGMLLSIIGVHGMLSGTASMDFAGKKNTGVAVGVIDGFVYFGGALGQMVLGKTLPNAKLDPVFAREPSHWSPWPLAMIPMAALGLLLSLRLWNAKPGPRATAH
jgi:MFS transporter, OPA family, glycerol-3-phosphate transporter